MALVYRTGFVSGNDEGTRGVVAFVYRTGVSGDDDGALGVVHLVY